MRTDGRDALDYVLEHWPPDVHFTATSIAAEVRRRYGAVLRRRRADGLVKEVREGRPHLEAEYRKVK